MPWEIENWNKWIKSGLSLTAIALLIWAHQLVLVVMLAIGFATVVKPLTEGLSSKLHISYKASAVVVFLGGAVSAFGVSYLLYYLAADQFVKLSQQVPAVLGQLEDLISQWIPSFRIDEEKVEASKFTGALAPALAGLASLARRLMASGTLALLGVVVSFYVALRPSYYVDLFLSLFDETDIDIHRSQLKQAGQSLRDWFGAQLIDMVIVALLTGVGLAIVGFEYWIAIGILTGLFSLVPYIGLGIVFVLSLLVAFANDASMVPSIFIVFGLTQFIEGNFILPRLLKERVAIPEALLIVSISFMGFWFGLLGALMTPGLLAIVLTDYSKSKVDEATC
mgnify:CR=1 FL=1